MEYLSASFTTTTQAKSGLWDYYKIGEDAKYVMTAQTKGTVKDQVIGACGLKEGRNFVMLAAWEMTDASNKKW